MFSRCHLLRKSCQKLKLKGNSFSSANTVRTKINENIETKNVKPVAYWLFGMSGLVAGMVTIGGITRITRSGLSMTDWKLQGNLPPITASEWETEFERYKQFPEWQQRKSMTVDEFKFIYFWEYGHRMLGRFLGVAFAGPAAYFAFRGMIPKMLYPRLALLFGLGGAQGLIGWWMVKSGLQMDPQKKDEIRVSPYRLATHLGMAFTTYTLLLWTGLDLMNSTEKAKKAALTISTQVLKRARTLRLGAVVNGALVATTVMSGAFVAGNDAGNAFNTFPMMDDSWIPDSVLELQPVWRNFFENTATVQFDHRVLALTTLTGIGAMYWTARRTLGGQLWLAIPSYTRAAFTATAHMSLVQVALGITTLLLYVPIPVAIVHQAGSLALLTCITGLAHSLRFVSFTSGLTAVAATAGAGTVVAGVVGVAATASARTVATAVAVEKAGAAGTAGASTVVAKIL